MLCTLVHIFSIESRKISYELLSTSYIGLLMEIAGKHQSAKTKTVCGNILVAIKTSEEKNFSVYNLMPK